LTEYCVPLKNSADAAAAAGAAAVASKMTYNNNFVMQPTVSVRDFAS
jgi:hypothetical protein